MEATLIAMGSMALVGAATGVAGLIAAWDRRKAPPAPAAKPDPVVHVEIEATELRAEMAALPAHLERAFERAAEKLIVPDLPEPDWHKELAEDLALANERMIAATKQRPQPELERLVAEVVRMNGQLGELLTAQSTPPEFPKMENMLGRLAEAIESRRREIVVTPQTGGIGGGSAPRALVAPPPSRDADVTLSVFNTLSLLEDEVYTLIPPEPGIYQINLANVGPGTLYIRADADPFPGDPESEMLPAGAFDNEIHIPVSLRVIADADTVITARLPFR